MVAQCRVAPRQGLVMRHPAGARHVDEHAQSGGAYATEEVEVLEPEEQLGVGKDARLDHGARHQSGPPGGHIHGRQLAGKTAAGHDVHAVARSGNEDTAEGHHGADSRPVIGGVASPNGDVRHQLGHARGGELQEHHVVFAQVRPVRGRVREGLLQATVEPTRRPGVRRQPNHADGSFELGVVEPALAVDNHHDAVGGEPLRLDERPHRGAGQARAEVGDHDGRHTFETSRDVRGYGVWGQDISQSAGTNTGDSTITPLGARMAMGPKASNDVSGCQGSMAVGPLPRGARIAPHNE